MKIKKIGHCCLVVEVGGVRIMTDPGAWTSGQENERNIDVILITHEHADHVHTESLKKVLENNPGCKIITNSAVKVLLERENLWQVQDENFLLLEEGELNVLGTRLYAKTCPHADIYDGIVPVLNTGFLIAERFFYPGDAYLEINKPIEVLALPVAGPWAKIREVIEYAKRVRPKIALPVHDGLIKENCIAPFRFLPSKFLGEAGIEFKDLNDGEFIEF